MGQANGKSTSATNDTRRSFDISPTIYPYTADILLFANFDFVRSFEALSGPNNYES